MQISFFHVYISPNKIIVRRNYNNQDKNDQSYAHLDISEPITATINISSLLPLVEFADSNLHISFENIREKNIL